VAPRLAARKSVACHVRGQAAEADQQAGWLATLVFFQEQPSRSSVRSNCIVDAVPRPDCAGTCAVTFSKQNSKIRMNVLCELLKDAVSCGVCVVLAIMNERAWSDGG